MRTIPLEKCWFSRMDILGITPEDAISYIAPTQSSFIALEDFEKFCKKNNLRRGQAWFNSLNREDRDQLTGTWWDPFHFDHWEAILVATIALLDVRVGARNVSIFTDLMCGRTRAGDLK